jgi:hypothetical protein
MKLAFAILAMLCLISTSQAREIHHHARHHLERHSVHISSVHRHHRYGHHAVSVAAQELPHPAGCPSVSFCGCGAAIEVFGRPVRDLWLASNWFRFPSTSPAPGMVAVRQHHVMVIRSVTGQGRAVVFDANSGHHRTQVHEVSLAGYSIRNPHGG